MDADAIHARIRTYFMTINPKNVKIRLFFTWKLPSALLEKFNANNLGNQKPLFAQAYAQITTMNFRISLNTTTGK